MGLDLHFTTGNRNSFIEEINIMDDFLVAAESEKFLDFSQNRPLKGTARADAKGECHKIEEIFIPSLCQSKVQPQMFL